MARISSVSGSIVRCFITGLFISIIACSCGVSGHREPSMDAIEKGFRNIPDSVLTSIYWYWISDNISREGVVRDLEAMKRAGINRAFIGNIGLNDLPFGKVKIFTPEWWDILHTALKKATELNISIGIFNSPGWSQSGGPWIKPERSMRYLNSSEISVSGPSRLHFKLDPPAVDFQRERIIAFRAPYGYDIKMADKKPSITSQPEDPVIRFISDGDTSTYVKLHKGEDLKVDFTFSTTDTVRSLVIRTAKIPVKAHAAFSCRTGSGYKVIRDFDIDRSNPSLTTGFEPYAPVVVTVPEISSKEFRLVFTGESASGGIAEVNFSPMEMEERYPEKSLAKMFQTPHPLWHDYLWPVQSESAGAGLVIDPAKIVDISDKLNPDGMLDWEVPEGKWVIMQTGMTTTGVVNEPATPEGTGLEADKMSREHIAFHFDSFLGEIIRRIPAQDRKCWKVVVEDSYERGGQNWTDGFIKNFSETYGYDPVPYIPVLKGYVVGSRDISDRFLWDLRRLVADRVAWDYVGGLREISHANGLTTWLENYGHWGFPAEFLQYGGQSDEIGGEFWSEGDLGDIENRAASSCAHIYGKKKVSAESFTCAGEPFSRYPAKLKKRGDRFFAEGINNTLLHVYISQPDDTPPGANAWFGNEFNRLNSWFDGMVYFTSYLKRADFMLQQGTYVADVAYFIGEDVPKMTGECNPPLPEGYSFDYINSEVIMNRLTVKSGKFVLPDGMSYRILVLPELETMRPELIEKLGELVKQGGVILGPAPLRSPSLKGFPGIDMRVRELAASLWNKVDGLSVKSAGNGKGKVMCGLNMQEALDAEGIRPDFNPGPDKHILFLHRHLSDGEIYYLTNQSDSVSEFTAEFRVAGKKPELWDPVSGEIRELPDYTIDKESVTVPLKLETSGSAFIIFRQQGHEINKNDRKPNFPGSEIIADIKGPWMVTFDHNMRGPARTVVFDTLCDWTESTNDSIRYFSGKAVYETEFSIANNYSGKKIGLSLSPVPGIAVVKVNGKSAGGVWTTPWNADISALTVPGKNMLEIEVMNTWVNRLIGDSKLPAGERKTRCFVNTFTPADKLAPSGLKGPVRIFTLRN